MRYEAKPRWLTIVFRGSGDTYVYFAVPGKEWGTFLEAESKGTYLNQIFKQKGYRYVVLPPDPGGPGTSRLQRVDTAPDVEEWGETWMLPRRADVGQFLKKRAA
jgi:hypothetical protein